MKYQYRENNVDPSKPLLYRITISGLRFYIGCANRANRPKKHYARNVARLESGKPYRKNNPTGFRKVHRVLFEAAKCGEEIVIELLRNVSATEKFSEEAREIEAYRRQYGASLLNGTDAGGRHRMSGDKGGPTQGSEPNLVVTAGLSPMQPEQSLGSSSIDLNGAAATSAPVV